MPAPRRPPPERESDAESGAGSGAGTAPRWLDADERAAWLALTGVLLRLPPALDAQLQRDAGLTYFEYLVLAMLSERADRRLRMSTLAALTHGSLSRLSHVAKRLERQGLLRREPSPQDGRFTDAILTDSGWGAVVAAAPAHVEAVRALVLDGLDRDAQRRLREIGERVLDRIAPGAPRPPVDGAAAHPE